MFSNSYKLNSLFIHFPLVIIFLWKRFYFDLKLLLLMNTWLEYPLVLEQSFYLGDFYS